MRLPLQARYRSAKVLALDPAKLRCGIATFENGRFYHAQTLRAKSTGAVVAKLVPLISLADVVVIEVPVTRKNAVGRDRNLEGLRRMVSLVAKACKADATPLVKVKPEAWKGSVPKEITAARAIELLDDEERENILDDTDDTTDALGLGLVAIDRAKRGLP